MANLDLIQAHFSDTSNLQISLSGIESHPLNCILKCNHAATGGLLWLPHHWCYDAKYGWGEKILIWSILVSTSVYGQNGLSNKNIDGLVLHKLCLEIF